MSKNLGHRADHYTETRCRRVTKNPPTTIISASDEGSGTAVVVPPVGTPLMIFKVPEPPAPSNSSSLKTKANGSGRRCRHFLLDGLVLGPETEIRDAN